VRCTQAGKPGTKEEPSLPAGIAKVTMAAVQQEMQNMLTLTNGGQDGDTGLASLAV
jgi:hypothetical protein